MSHNESRKGAKVSGCSVKEVKGVKSVSSECPHHSALFVVHGCPLSCQPPWSRHRLCPQTSDNVSVSWIIPGALKKMFWEADVPVQRWSTMTRQPGCVLMYCASPFPITTQQFQLWPEKLLIPMLLTPLLSLTVHFPWEAGGKWSDNGMILRVWWDAEQRLPNPPFAPVDPRGRI